MAKRLRNEPAEAGDNSGGTIDGEALRRYVSRAMALLEARDEIGEDLKEVYKEAKEAGFVTAQLRQIVKEQRMEPLTLQAHLDAMDMLRHALGGLVETPLGEAALDAAEEYVQKAAATHRRVKKIEEAMEAAREHLGGGDL